MSRFQDLFPQATAIIFDLGNVVLNIDYVRTQHAFEVFGFTNFGELYSQARQAGLFDLFETGKITPAVFRDEVRKLSPAIALSDEQIDRAWNAMLLDLPLARLELLTILKKKYRTFLLSNTNAIHLEALSSYLKKEYGVESLFPYFEKNYYSSEIGLRKPDTGCYEYVLRENKLNPYATVFIDDLLPNIESAKHTGLQTYHLTGGETIIDLFS